MRPETSPSTDFPGIEVRRERPLALYPLLLLIGILSVAGFGGGWSLMTDRTGASLQVDLAWLDHTPVSDFLLPGLFLFLVYGVFGFVLMLGLWTRWSSGPLMSLDRSTGRLWSWWGTLALGSILVAWIAYELFVIPDLIWLQPALAATGLAMVGLALLPSMRAYGRRSSRKGDR
jgi:hypothetical protein